ncbi:hypothetical protein [Nocardia jejuensis]|uniref:hypothetical protein n=1 Tax=Nocardia jejuensis TaxID=328049 RepID=UPI00082F9273|nr:hypothetical protein [Nocardia jejuensis]
MIEVHGGVEAGFEAVAIEFAALAAAECVETGSQLAVFHHGEPVVDLWTGPDPAGDRGSARAVAARNRARVVGAACHSVVAEHSAVYADPGTGISFAYTGRAPVAPGHARLAAAVRDSLTAALGRP